MFNKLETHKETLAILTKLVAIELQDELNAMSDETLEDVSNAIADNAHGIVSQCVIDLVDQLSNS
jgi:hypothetical protein